MKSKGSGYTPWEGRNPLPMAHSLLKQVIFHFCIKAKPFSSAFAYPDMRKKLVLSDSELIL
jgi:hypothetical protein